MLRQVELQTSVARIQQMEQYFDEVLAVLENKPDCLYEDATIQKMIKELTEYMESGQWLQDYECDERGELPEDLKRGVLAQDALYDLLCGLENMEGLL
ncbi:MAG: DUF4298 domain-containing protein [Roseburia sp.]|nr:DUF4298 domain-containing protein [Roseburia sp.]